jgi:hypothetical protein
MVKVRRLLGPLCVGWELHGLEAMFEFKSMSPNFKKGGHQYSLAQRTAIVSIALVILRLIPSTTSRACIGRSSG